MGALNLDLLQKVMQLMVDHKIDEVACEEFTVKMSRHAVKVVELTEEDKHQAALQQHLEPLPTEPWQSISDDELAAWSVNKGAV